MSKFENVVISGKTLEVLAATYERVGDVGDGNDEDIRVGDVIVYDWAPHSGITTGAAYVVERIDSCDDAQITDDDGREYDTCGDEFTTYRKAASTTFKAGDVVVSKTGSPSWKTTLTKRAPEFDGLYGRAWNHTHDSGWIGEDQIKLAEPPQQWRPTIGDYVEIVDRSGFINYEMGEIVRIVSDDHSSAPYRALRLDGSIGNWLALNNLAPATQADFRAAGGPVFAEGLYVKLISGANQRYLQGFTNGEICKVITDIDTDGDIRIMRKSGIRGYARPDQLEVLSADAAKWFELEREVNEYKRGDIVRITGNTNNSVNKVGDIGVIGTGPSDLGSFRVSVNGNGVDNWTRPYDMELVAPVDRRVDAPVPV